MKNMFEAQRDLDRWIKVGEKDGAKYLLVICDTFSYEDYPVYVYPVGVISKRGLGENFTNLEAAKKHYSTNMQRVEQVIKLKPVKKQNRATNLKEQAKKEYKEGRISKKLYNEIVRLLDNKNKPTKEMIAYAKELEPIAKKLLNKQEE